MTSDKHDKLFSSSPPIPEFLRRQTPDPRDEQIADLTAKLAEAERERDAANFDKARMLDERQIFLKGMDELRAEVAKWKAYVEGQQDNVKAAEHVATICNQARESAETRLTALRATIEWAHHGMEMARIWGGMDWHWNHLASFRAKAIWERLDAALAESHDLDLRTQAAKFESPETRLRELREWITAAHHLPLCKKWSYALDEQMQLVPVLVHDAECTCGRDSILAKSGEP